MPPTGSGILKKKKQLSSPKLNPSLHIQTFAGGLYDSLNQISSKEGKKQHRIAQIYLDLNQLK